MRWLALIAIGLMMASVVSCVQETSSPNDAETPSAAKEKECPSGGCCSSISRAGLLKKAQPEKPQ